MTNWQSGCSWGMEEETIDIYEQNELNLTGILLESR
jgi:hypothetical protein